MDVPAAQSANRKQWPGLHTSKAVKILFSFSTSADNPAVQRTECRQWLLFSGSARR
jgi:hypothetical protein